MPLTNAPPSSILDVLLSSPDIAISLTQSLRVSTERGFGSNDISHVVLTQDDHETRIPAATIPDLIHVLQAVQNA